MTILSTLTVPLFVPGNRPNLFSKAAASGSDALIIDLEDGVPSDAKEFARAQLVKLPVQLPVIVRINGVGTTAHSADLAALADLPIDCIMLPKAERVEDILTIALIAPVIALIETAVGIANARTIAFSGATVRLAFGSIDYAADIGCDHAHEPLLNARSELVLASRLGSLPPPLDGVTPNVATSDFAEKDARLSRGLGFGGKLLIHPAQVGPVKRGFAPSRSEIGWAKRVLDDNDGAVQIDGMMIDEPVRMRARAILKLVGN